MTVMSSDVVVQASRGRSVKAGVQRLGGRAVMLFRVSPSEHAGALTLADGEKIAAAAKLALDQRCPLIGVIDSSGADIHDGVAALHGWGLAARGMQRCSGTVPVILVVAGAAVSGPALLLGLADIVIAARGAFAYVSGPDRVSAMTGWTVSRRDLGGADQLARLSGVAWLVAGDVEEALEMAAEALSFLPDHADAPPPTVDTSDPVDRPTDELRQLIPPSPTGGYDVRRVLEAVADDGYLFELRARWAPQLVTGFARVGGRPAGLLANQPQTMAGTLDIGASQKGAAFVELCDAFNLPIVTVVDTPGFMPGKDLEWRGMIRHGAQLVFAYAAATVPRICLLVRKAYGGAYIVMDSKGLGNDICLAWPSAEVAVMGARGAVQILHRGESLERQAALEAAYGEQFLNPYVAAERGLVDAVVDPGDTRWAIHHALKMLDSKREDLPKRKHDNRPL